jgi:hypothetical protein
MLESLVKHRDIIATLATGGTVLTFIIGSTAYFIRNYPDKNYIDGGIHKLQCLMNANLEILHINVEAQLSQTIADSDKEVLDSLKLKEKVGLTDVETLIQTQKLRDLSSRTDEQRAFGVRLGEYEERIKPGGSCDGKGSP